MAPKSTARLRTKTGCLQCRLARVKCDEQPPVCRRCTSNKASCQWPTTKDTVDRRHRKWPEVVIGVHPPMPESNRSGQQYSESPKECYPASTSTSNPQSIDEDFLFNHFASNLLPTLVRKDAHGSSAILEYMLSMALQSETLMAAMQACSAMDMARSSAISASLDIALNYYVSAVRGLQKLINSEEYSSLQDELLATISCLLIFENSRIDALPKFGSHINAMAHLFCRRSFSGESSANCSGAFGHLMVESFLYHGSLLMLFDHDFDPFRDARLLPVLQYYLQQESSERCFPDNAYERFVSPILLAPSPFYFLIADITRFSTASTLTPRAEQDCAWHMLNQRLLAFEHRRPQGGDDKNPSKLHLLAARALISKPWMQPSDVESWMSLDIIVDQSLEELVLAEVEWSFTSYSLWPLAVLGSMTTSANEIELVRSLIQQVVKNKENKLSQWIVRRLEDIWNKITFGQVLRGDQRLAGLYSLTHGESLNSTPMIV